MYQVEGKTNDQYYRKRKRNSEEGGEKEIGREGKAEAQEYRDAETEGLIREYQKNAKPTKATMKLLELYG